MIPHIPWGAGAGWRALAWALRAEFEDAVRRMAGGSVFDQLHQWGLTYAALVTGGAGRDAGRRARQVHRHRDALQRIYSRTTDLVQLTRTELDARACAVGIEDVGLDRSVLHAFVARVEVERELRTLDARVRALTVARDWPELEEALRKGLVLVLRYEGHAEHDAAVRELRERIAEGGYRVLPGDPAARSEEVPC